MPRLPRTTARERPENLAILLREPFREATAHLHERLAERGHPAVRPPHGDVLQYLDDAGTPVAELARRAHVTKQSMAELVEHLERHGYVERIPDPRDRRAKLVRATDRGREVYTVAREFIAEIEREWTARLGPGKMRRLRQLLEELNEGL